MNVACIAGDSARVRDVSQAGSPQENDLLTEYLERVYRQMCGCRRTPKDSAVMGLALAPLPPLISRGHVGELWAGPCGCSAHLPGATAVPRWPRWPLSVFLPRLPSGRTHLETESLGRAGVWGGERGQHVRKSSLLGSRDGGIWLLVFTWPECCTLSASLASPEAQPGRGTYDEVHTD